MTDNLSKQEPDKLKQLDQDGLDTLNALLTFNNKTKAAEYLQINRSSLYERIGRYGLDKIIESIPKKAIQTLQLGSEKAAQVLVDSLDHRPERLEAAKEVLDRVGVTSQKPQIAQQFNINEEKMELDVRFNDSVVQDPVTKEWLPNPVPPKFPIIEIK